jgi:hypothetical protein
VILTIGVILLQAIAGTGAPGIHPHAAVRQKLNTHVGAHGSSSGRGLRQCVPAMPRRTPQQVYAVRMVG